MNKELATIRSLSSRKDLVIFLSEVVFLSEVAMVHVAMAQIRASHPLRNCAEWAKRGEKQCEESDLRCQFCTEEGKRKTRTNAGRDSNYMQEAICSGYRTKNDIDLFLFEPRQHSGTGGKSLAEVLGGWHRKSDGPMGIIDWIGGIFILCGVFIYTCSSGSFVLHPAILARPHASRTLGLLAIRVIKELWE
jgi:hypothetical protein